MFKKVVIADRLAVAVDAVYNNPDGHRGLAFPVATLFFAFQIYCDFSGYSDIALGAAQVMGFRLMENFRRPYLAQTIGEFWTRWHISLSTWFRDYLYIPLGGSRASVPRWYLNLIIVFVLSGIWHGASWAFVVWGGLHAFYMVFGIATGSLRARLGRLLRLRHVPRLHACLRTVATFFLVSIGWVFFRAASARAGLTILSRCITGPAEVLRNALTFGSTEAHTGLSRLYENGREFYLAVFFMVLLASIELWQEKTGDRDFRTVFAPYPCRSAGPFTKRPAFVSCSWASTTPGNSSISSFSEPGSMKKLLLRLFVAAALQVPFVGFFEYKLGEIPTILETKKNALETRLPVLETLVLGSSQTLNGVRPEYLPGPAFNLGNHSQDLYYDVELFRRYQSRLPQLRRVLLEIAYFGFEYNLDDSPEAWRTFTYRKTYGIPHRHLREEIDLRNFSLLASYGNARTLDLAFEGFPSAPLPVTRLGWLASERLPELRATGLTLESGRNRVAFHQSMMKAAYFGGNQAKCEQFCEACRPAHVEACLFTPPVNASYRCWIDSRKYAVMQATIESLQKKYAVRYLNYFYDARFLEDDFADHDHLNPLGAAKLSSILAADLEARRE